MADVILDQIGEEEIKKLYGKKWRKSALNCRPDAAGDGLPVWPTAARPCVG